MTAEVHTSDTQTQNNLQGAVGVNMRLAEKGQPHSCKGNATAVSNSQGDCLSLQ